MKRALGIFGLCLCVGLFLTAISSADGPATQPDDGVIRIKAGMDKPFTDPHGHVWQADKGFDGGDTTDRDSTLKIDNTDMPDFYRHEHYDMTGWSGDVPNGTYTVNLYFCETYDGVTDAGQRVFNVKVGDQALKNFDIYKEAGGPQKPLIKTQDHLRSRRTISGNQRYRNHPAKIASHISKSNSAACRVRLGRFSPRQALSPSEACVHYYMNTGRSDG
jgi:Malectin domain